MAVSYRETVFEFVQRNLCRREISAGNVDVHLDRETDEKWHRRRGCVRHHLIEILGRDHDDARAAEIDEIRIAHRSRSGVRERSVTRCDDVRRLGSDYNRRDAARAAGWSM